MKPILVLSLVVLCSSIPCFHSQSCSPRLCDTNVMPFSWRSNHTVRRLPSTTPTFATVSITWQPDPSIEPGMRVYKVVTRNRDEEGANFSLARNTSSFDEFILDDLDFSTRYDLLVCYANVTRRVLGTSDSLLIPQCGYCRICFRTANQGEFIDITSATVANVLVSSEVVSVIYECRAVGIPLPLLIYWQAQEMGSNNVIQLTNSIDGVQISNYTNNSEIVSVLRLSNNFQSVTCGANNSQSASRRDFQRIDPIIAFINITEATVREVLSSQILHATYQCRAIGFPLPLHITWRAEDNDEGNIIELTDTILGVEIINSIKNGQTVSELNLLNLDNVDFSSVACIVSNGYYPEVVQEQFLQENFSDPDNVTNMATDVTTLEDFSSTVSIPVYSIVLLIVLPLIALPIIAVVSIFLYRRFQCTKENKVIKAIEMTTRLGLTIPLENINGSITKPKSAVDVLKEKLPDDMFILPTNLNVSSIIGQGEFGVIYKAFMESKDCAIQEPVAVKTLKGIFSTSSDIAQATEEIIKMSHFDHPNVMSLVGVCVAPSEEGSSSVGPSIVMPFMDQGSLLDYLRKEADNLIATNEDEILIVKKPLVQICQQIARGMEYLSKLKFVHRDLAARNCLMNSNGVIKVSDFGLTEDIYSRNYFRQAKDGAKLPLKWMALESIKLGVFSEKSDVWSYGVTLWEVFSGGAIPYPGIHPQAILELLEDGQRLSKPKNAACCSTMYGLLRCCLEEKPEKRPKFSDILQTLDHYLECTADYVDLTGLRANSFDILSKDEGDQREYFAASPVEDEQEYNLETRVVVKLNDYTAHKA